MTGLPNKHWTASKLQVSFKSFRIVFIYSEWAPSKYMTKIWKEKKKNGEIGFESSIASKGTIEGIKSRLLYLSS